MLGLAEHYSPSPLGDFDIQLFFKATLAYYWKYDIEIWSIF